MTRTETGAIVYCEGAFGTTNGKTAHGLVRRSGRYPVLAVVDSKTAGRDAGMILDGREVGIPVVPSLTAALELSGSGGRAASHFVIGLAPDGGRLPGSAKPAVLAAIEHGLSVDSGLHDFLSEDPEIAAAATERGVEIRDVRKPPPRSELHFFSGKIEEVGSLKVALLGTDSAVGKRTTGWLLKDALEATGRTVEMVGTGQTSWMQGARFGIVVDSIVSDFVAGEIEHVVWSAWSETRPDVILLEGQGSLMNPAYPGGFELLAAGRPEAIVLQHAPARLEYDGFPGYPIHALETQIEALELLSGKPVVAIALNHENLSDEELAAAEEDVRRSTGLPVASPLKRGCGPLVEALAPHLERGG